MFQTLVDLLGFKAGFLMSLLVIILMVLAVSITIILVEITRTLEKLSHKKINEFKRFFANCFLFNLIFCNFIFGNILPGLGRILSRSDRFSTGRQKEESHFWTCQKSVLSRYFLYSIGIVYSILCRTSYQVALFSSVIS